MADTANIGRAAGVSGSHAGEPAIHPLYVRITHWINALAVLVMIGSGWQIYNASPLFPFRFPQSALGGWLAGGLLWHFAAMWVLVVNGLVYLTLALATGRFRRKLLPIRPAEVAHDLGAALTGRLRHDDVGKLQRRAEAALCRHSADRRRDRAVGPRHLETGAAAGSLRSCSAAMNSARVVHFFAMAAIVLFLVLHVVMALLVPKSLRAMIRGR